MTYALPLLRELRGGRVETRPLALDGARELVPVLARELRMGGDAGAVREGFDPRSDTAALIWIGPPAEETLRAAARKRVPIVGITEGESLPYVLDTDLIVLGPGEGFPPDEIGRTLGRLLGESAAGIALRLPALRPGIIDALIHSTARRNGIAAAAIFIPGVDMPVLTVNQIRLVLAIARAYGEQVDLNRLPELLGVVGAGFGLRALARELLDLVPVAGWATKGAVAYTGTVAIGRAAERYFEERRTPGA